MEKIYFYEIWKPIKDYEGYYEVSNYGRVKSIGNRGRILKPKKGNNRYYYVILSKNGKPQTKRIHRLVAEAFIPNPDNKPYVDHINTDRNDNRVENLRWVTHKENMNNPITINRIGRKSKSIVQYNCDTKIIINNWNSVTEYFRSNWNN